VRTCPCLGSILLERKEWLTLFFLEECSPGRGTSALAYSWVRYHKTLCAANRLRRPKPLGTTAQAWSASENLCSTSAPPVDSPLETLGYDIMAASLMRSIVTHTAQVPFYRYFAHSFGHRLVHSSVIIRLLHSRLRSYHHIILGVRPIAALFMP